MARALGQALSTETTIGDTGPGARYSGLGASDLGCGEFALGDVPCFLIGEPLHF